MKENRIGYEELVKLMLDATNSKEVNYYENKIHELLDKMGKNSIKLHSITKT